MSARASKAPPPGKFTLSARTTDDDRLALGIEGPRGLSEVFLNDADVKALVEILNAFLTPA
jgi:hypothetical protein